MRGLGDRTGCVAQLLACLLEAAAAADPAEADVPVDDPEGDVGNQPPGLHEGADLLPLGGAGNGVANGVVR